MSEKSEDLSSWKIINSLRQKCFDINHFQLERASRKLLPQDEDAIYWRLLRGPFYSGHSIFLRANRKKIFDIVNSDSMNPEINKYNFEMKCNPCNGSYARAQNQYELNELKQALLTLGFGSSTTSQLDSHVPPPSAMNLLTVTMFTQLTEMDEQCWISMTDSGKVTSLKTKLKKMELPSPLLNKGCPESGRPSEHTLVFSKFVLAKPPKSVFISGAELDQIINEPLEWESNKDPSKSLPPYMS